MEDARRGPGNPCLRVHTRVPSLQRGLQPTPDPARSNNRGVYLLARHYQRICGFWTTSRCCEWNGEVIPEATIVRFRLVPQGLEIDGFRVMQGPMRRQQWGCIHPG